MIRIVFANFFGVCRRNLSFFVLSFTCLVCAFTSIIFIQARGQYSYLESVNDSRANQILQFASKDADTIKSVYAKLINSSELPAIKVATASDEVYSGIYWNANPDEETYYTPYGRFFNADEMESGANVALLATGFISQLTPERIDAIWETGIDVNGVHFSAIGNYLYDMGAAEAPDDILDRLTIPTLVAIPLKTYFDIGFNAMRFRCVFAQPLTVKQIAYVSDIMRSAKDATRLTLPQEHDTDAISSYLQVIIPYSLIMVMMSITTVLLYWLSKEFKRYKIYLICGARGGLIALMISFNVTLLVTLAYICAFFAASAVIAIVPEGMVAPLPFSFHLILYSCALLTALLTVNINALSIVSPKKIL